MPRIKIKPEGDVKEAKRSDSLFVVKEAINTANQHFSTGPRILSSPATTLEGKADDMRNYVHFVTTKTRALLEKAMKVLDRQLDSDNEITCGYAVKHTIPVADLNLKLMKRLDELDEAVAAKLAKEAPLDTIDESTILAEGEAALAAIKEARVA